MGDQRGSSTTGERGPDNVVQLPRDWLGPRDELVPFGPRAWAQDAAADVGAEGAIGADDFWGENSESLHTAVRGPASSPTAAAGRAGPGAAPQPAGVQARSSRRGMSLNVPVAAAVVVAATFAAVALLVLAAGGVRPAPAPVFAATDNAGALIGRLSSTGGTIDAGVRRLASLQLSTAHRPRPHSTLHRGRRRAAARATGAVGANSGGVTAPPVPARPVPSYTPSSTAASPNAAGTRAPSGSSGDAAAAGGGATSSTASNQPAFGADGTLGPGSSPNG